MDSWKERGGTVGGKIMNLGAILENLALEAYRAEEEARKKNQRVRVAIPPPPSNRPCFWRPWEDSEESEEAGDFRTRQLLRRFVSCL